MAGGLRKVFPPRVHPMPADEKSVNLRILLQHLRRFRTQRFHVLAVLDNRDPFPMLVCRDAVQPFQHLVAFDEKPALAHVIVRKNRAPHRMCVENRAGTPAVDDRRMQQRFGGRLSRIRRQDAAVAVDFENVLRLEVSFVQRTRGNRNPQGIAADDGAEVAACAENPAPPMEVAAELDEMFCRIHSGIIIARVSTEKVHGRGASSNPRNRFETLAYEVSDWDEPGDPSRRTVFLRDETRSIIAFNDSPDVGFDASINPYRGCEHGCIYCFARPNHEYLGFSAGLDFETKILVKEDAPELLRRELASPKWKPQVIAISGVTDAYQPVERRLQLTRRCLEVLVEFRNPVVIITKNDLVTRDIDLLSQLAKFDGVLVFVSVTSLDHELARELEPRASQPAKRLAAIEALSAAGVPVGSLIAPCIPGLTDHEMPSIISAVAKAGAVAAGYVPLRLPHGVAPLFEEWLTLHRPLQKDKILSRVREIRGGKLNDPKFRSRMRGSGAYADQIAELFEVCCRKAGINSKRPQLSARQFRRPGPAQLGLF